MEALSGPVTTPPSQPSSPLFKFGLLPIEDVCRFHSEHGSKLLNWYGLTDGWYTIDAGGVKLFRRNPHLIEATPQWQWRTPYLDYLVIHLHDGVLDLLPHALDPIPPDVLDWVRTPELHKAFDERSYRWSDIFWTPGSEQPTSAELEKSASHSDFWRHAAGWWLEAPNLAGGSWPGQPDVRIWSEGGSVFIRWNECKQVETTTGLRWNIQPPGEYSLPIATFIAEVRQFHTLLMEQMRHRLDIAKHNWPLPQVHFNIEEAEREHAWRSRTFDEAMEKARKARRDWDKVRWAMAEVIRLVGE